jgi:LacI family repressor for deo operon, udp, cdd, tsx, nupC, and nupG
VAGDFSVTSAHDRRHTYLDTVGSIGIRGDVATRLVGRSGYDAIAALPADTPVTAVVAANDRVATA